jgi:hypothetical protein
VSTTHIVFFDGRTAVPQGQEDEDHVFSENERFYDAEIAPALREIGKRCTDRGMSLIASVQFDEGSADRGSTFYLSPNPNLAMIMLRFCAKAGENVDRFMISLARYCHEKGIDTSESIYLGRFGGGKL